MAKSKPRDPMPVSERAKQFMPFAAVSGLTQALERKERELMLTERKEPTEERARKINLFLNKIEKGSEVAVTYFAQGEYLTVSGAVAGVDKVERVLTAGGVKIPFDDLYDVEII
ncbi:MAG: YolD-like family protein [Oscillospiraceae bacterium]|nr:YolD-like family protein [Oscillospiraceae bacterium]